MSEQLLDGDPVVQDATVPPLGDLPLAERQDAVAGGILSGVQRGHLRCMGVIGAACW